MYLETKMSSSPIIGGRPRKTTIFRSWSAYTMLLALGWFYCLLTWNNSFATALSCFECDSSNDFTCTERWDSTEPTVRTYLNYDCLHVHQAKYCVKMTGIYDGKLGTKRFCSSKDWGNYCEYIKRPGDTQEYRSCVFSCSRSECNTASERLQISHWTMYSITLITVFAQILFWKQ